VDYVTQKKIEPPVVPALVPRVLAIVDEPEVDLLKLTQVIQQDLAISAKLLSVANSPLFGSSVEVKTVRQAIAHLGTEQVAQIAIGLACRSNLESRTTLGTAYGVRWQRLFQHSMTCAFAAAQLAGKADKVAQEAAFLGGLFHDVGQAVALRAIEALLATGQLNIPEGPAGDRVIDEALHRIHAYPGDEFHRKWTLPDALMQLCARHHQLDDVEDVNRTFYLVTLTSSFDALLRGDVAERREALDEARTSAQRLFLTELALRTAYEDTRVIGDRTARLFAG
jgi:putative nucleotidyltransferase with HDIG domain